MNNATLVGTRWKHLKVGQRIVVPATWLGMSMERHPEGIPVKITRLINTSTDRKQVICDHGELPSKHNNFWYALIA